MNRHNKQWTHEEHCIANEMSDDGFTPESIAARLGRTVEGVKTMLRIRERSEVSVKAGREALDRWRSEFDRISTVALTPNQICLGDPLPGRSALERMNRGGRV